MATENSQNAQNQSQQEQADPQAAVVAAIANNGQPIQSPGPNQTAVVAVAAGETAQFGFDPADAEVARQGDDLVLTLENGGKVVLQGFAAAAEGENPPQILLPDGSILAGDIIVAQISDGSADLQTLAAAAALNNGSNIYSDDAGAALAGLDAQGPLDPTPFPRSAPEPELGAELIPDDTPTILVTPPELIPETPGFEPTSDLPLSLEDSRGVVDESALPDGSGGGTTQTSGTIEFDTGDDELQALEIRGPDGVWVNITNGGVIAGQYGTLVINPDYTWTYTLDGNTLEHGDTSTTDGDSDRGLGDILLDGWTVRVTDVDGDQASDMLTVAVTDDGPIAVDDNTSGGPNAPVTYNVMANDQEGADGAVLESAAMAAGFEADGAVSIDPNTGEVTFTPSSGFSGVTVVDYQIVDTEGDISQATLTINIDAPPPQNQPPRATPGRAVVSDEGLEGGLPDSDPIPDDETDLAVASGSVFAVDPDGDPLTVTLSTVGLPALTTDGAPIIWSGDGTSQIVGAAGEDPIITIDIDAAGGYTVTLGGPVDHPVAGTEDQLSFPVQVSVFDGAATTLTTLTVEIEDDEPEAGDDTATIEEEQDSVSGDVLANDAAGGDGLDRIIWADADEIYGNEEGGDGTDTDGVIYGNYGYLEVDDGQYVYHLDNDNPDVQEIANGETLEDVFDYAIVDNDEDSDNAQLAVTIVGANDIPDQEFSLTVDEDDLLNGLGDSGPNDDVVADSDGDGDETTNLFTVDFGDAGSGTISFTALDGQPVIDTDTDQVQSIDGVDLIWNWDGGSQTLTAVTDDEDGNVILRISPESGNNYKVEILEPVKHKVPADPTGDANEDNINLSLEFDVSDGVGGAGDGFLLLSLDDDSPVAKDDTNTITEESASISNNVVTGRIPAEGDDMGADGFGGILWADSDEDGIVYGNYGYLEVDSDGGYVYHLDNANAAVDGLDAGDTLGESFDYTAYDQDNDGSGATLTITINGSDDPPQTEPTDVAVSEEGLAYGNPDSAGSADTTNSVSASGNLNITDVDDSAWTVTLKDDGLAALGLTSDGTTILWAGDGTNQLVGSAGGSPIITIDIDDAGDYDVTLSGPVDHSDANTESDLDITVKANVFDGTNNVEASFVITVEDDSPLTDDDGNTIGEGNDSVAGDVLDNDDPGADGFDHIVWADSDDDGGTPGEDDNGVIYGNYGYLTVDNAGGYVYHLDNDNPDVIALADGDDTLQDAFDYTIFDNDDDSANATLTITITGEDDPPQTEPTDVAVSEEGLAYGNPDSAGSADTTNSASCQRQSEHHRCGRQRLDRDPEGRWSGGARPDLRRDHHPVGR